MNIKEIIILALVFIGTMLFRVAYWKDFEGGFFLGIMNMMIAGFVMYQYSNRLNNTKD